MNLIQTIKNNKFADPIMITSMSGINMFRKSIEEANVKYFEFDADNFGLDHAYWELRDAEIKTDGVGQTTASSLFDPQKALEERKQINSLIVILKNIKTIDNFQQVRYSVLFKRLREKDYPITMIAQIDPGCWEKCKDKFDIFAKEEEYTEEKPL